MSQGKDPVLEEFARWLQEDWAHILLVIMLVVSFGLAIALLLVRRKGG